MSYQVFENPGAGRAKLRLSRGLPRCLAYDVTPYGIGRPIDEGTRGVQIAWQDDAESPGAGRAKLRLSRGFPRCLAHDVILYGIGQPIDKRTHGGSRGKAQSTRKAPVRTEPHRSLLLPGAFSSSPASDSLTSRLRLRRRGRRRGQSLATPRKNVK
jgi:hypothetical protein